MSTLRRTRLKGWYEFYKEPCHICNKRGGCMINEEGDTIVCIRVESDVVFSKTLLSWVHPLKKKRKVFVDKEYIAGNKKKPASELHAVYQALLDETYLTDEHYQHLTNRGMSDNEIVTRSYRSFPDKAWEIAKILLQQFNDFKGIPGFYENQYGWTIAGNPGILIPYRNEKNQIIGFQIRVNQPLKEVEIRKISAFKDVNLDAKVIDQEENIVEIYVDNEVVEVVKLKLNETHALYKYGAFIKLVEGQRYFWLSSTNKKNGTSAGNPLPVHVAVPTNELKLWQTGQLKQKNSVWITEGALKADIAAEKITKSALREHGMTFLAIAGVNTWRSVFDVLKKMNVKQVNLAFDMDLLENPLVAQQLKLFAQELKKQGFAANLAVWNPDDGKGIDDVLLNRRIPTLKKLF